VAIEADDERWDDYVAAGADHLIVMTRDPFDLDAVARLVDASRS
jgi:hypothetical protein